MRIAFFSPLPPVPSALADFGEGLALGLTDIPGIELDLFLSGDYAPGASPLLQRVKTFACDEFKERASRYDLTLYSLGDHGDYHGFMLDFIHQYPGIVILNDLTLHRCILHTALRRSDINFYLRDLRYACGLGDMRFADQIHSGLGNELIMDYPLFERIVDSSLGVVVQNGYAKDRISMRCPKARVKCIPYPFFMPPGCPPFDLEEQRLQQRKLMNLSGRFVVGSFGIIVPDKHIDHCLSAFARVAQREPGARYILGGNVVENYSVETLVHQLGLEEQVIITGWLPPKEFVRYMFALDVGIHLRFPHIGGTPYTPIRLMGLEICTFISDIEPLAELPSGACIKIVPDDSQEEVLATLLEYVVENPEFGRKVAENGRRIIAGNYGLEGVAQEYIRFAESLL